MPRGHGQTVSALVAHPERPIAAVSVVTAPAQQAIKFELLSFGETREERELRPSVVYLSRQEAYLLRFELNKCLSELDELLREKSENPKKKPK